MANWLSGLFGSKSKPLSEVTNEPGGVTTMADLFTDSVGLAYSNQFHLSDRLGEHSWEADLVAGTLSFVSNDGRPTITVKANVLGTESEESGTWLWAWANERSSLPESAMRLSLKLREYGQARGIRELTERSLPREKWDAHRISIIAEGVLDGHAYYLGPFGQGSRIAFLIDDPSFRPVRALPVFEFQRTLLRVMSEYGGDVNPRRACLAFARRLELTVKDAATINVSGPDGDANVSFDSLGRLSDIKGSLRKP